MILQPLCRYVTIHELEPEDDDHSEWSVPAKGQQSDIATMALTYHFLITGTSRGNIAYYLVEDRNVVNEFRHDDGGIVRLFPQQDGTRLVFEDDTRAIFLYNPVNDEVTGPPIPSSYRRTLYPA